MNSKRIFLPVLFILSLALTGSSGVFAAPSHLVASLTPNQATYDYRLLSGKHTVIGTQQFLVILVDFQDVHRTKSAQEIQNVVVKQVNSYYNEVSYGKVSITGQVFGWYTVSHTMGYYGSDSKQPGDDDNVQQLARDAVNLLPNSVDLTRFKFLMIVHAGADQAVDQSTQQSAEIWSECFCAVFPNYGAETPIIAPGGKAFANYLFLSELNGFGTYAHEIGHALGLPDLYQYPTASSEWKSYVGYWSLMDSGNWCCSNDAQTTPSYIGGWGAALLGWLTPAVAESESLVSAFALKPLESSDASTILIPISPTTYYFLEYRTQTGSDSHLPNSGILLYYVNEERDTGTGILQLVSPTTGIPLAAQAYPRDFNNVFFTSTARFRDPTNRVYLVFLAESTITALFSREEGPTSIVQSRITMGQTVLSGTYEDSVSVAATLYDTSGLPLGNQQVDVDVLTFTGDWQKVSSAITDPVGRISFALPLTYAVGQHSFRFFFAGGKGTPSWYTSAETEFVVNVEPAKMVITLSSLSGVTLGQSLIDIAVANAYGQPLTHVLVTIYVGNLRQGTVETDQNGQATLLLSFGITEIGSRTVTVSAETDNYVPAQTSETIFVLAPFFIVLLVTVVAAGVGAFVWSAKRARGQPTRPASPPTVPPAQGTKFCVSCGFRLRSNVRFCVRCRAKQH